MWLSRFAWTNRMAMYASAFDESDHPDDSEHLVVAGAIAAVDQWKRLEGEWRAVLEPLGVDMFHYCDFGDTPERETALVKLAQIIRRRVERSIAVVVPLREYHRINRSFLLGELVGFPYPLAARFCMGQVQGWANQHEISRPVLTILETGAKHQGQLESLACRDRVPAPDYRDKDFIPLQAADPIAGEIAAHVRLGHRRALSEVNERLQSIVPTLNEGRWLDVKLNALPVIFDVPRRDPALRYHC